MTFHRIGLLSKISQFAVEDFEPLNRRIIGFLGQRDPLDLQLALPTFDNVDLRRHRVDLDSQTGGRFVNEVDGLVGEEARGDVAVAQHRRSHQRTVLDTHAVVYFVSLLETSQDRNR